MTRLQTISEDLLAGIERGAHVAWVVDDAESFIRIAKLVLASADCSNEKTVVFGPADGDTLTALGSHALIATDPRVAFLGGGRLDGPAMFAMFREQTELARREGYAGLRVLADMDWLLASNPSPGDVLAFELLLDRVIEELEATVICAYRRSSFGEDVPLAVHPVLSEGTLSEGTEPPFRLVSDGPTTWRIAGEVDYGVGASFTAAINTACGAGSNVIDLSELAFIDVSGLRTLARACAGAEGPIRLRGASRSFQRFWRLGLFDDIAPLDRMVVLPDVPPVPSALN